MARPIVFLDFDDVIALCDVYGGRDAISPNPPADLWNKLFSQTAIRALRDVYHEFQPQFVLTTSWLRFMDRSAARIILGRGHLGFVAKNLHAQWDAEQLYGRSRMDSIWRWLSNHHAGEPFVILDDVNSGTGLRDASWYHRGHVVLCREGVGLTADHLPAIRAALTTVPGVKPEP